jgi:hypothetical protein
MRRAPFLRLGESLFPDAPPARMTLGRGESATLIVALLALAVILQLARVGLSASLNSLWAEDGLIYLQEALWQDSWHAVVHTYATYLVLVPRLIAEAATLVPLQDMAAAMSILSAAVVALSGLVVWHASAAHVRDPYLRGTLAALTVLCPVAGLESLDSAAYVPWFMLFATFWILLWRPRTMRGAVLAALFALATGLSTPGVWFFLPLAALRATAARDRRDLTILAGFAIGAAVQVPVLALNNEPAVAPLWTSDIWTVFLQRVVDGAPLGLRLGGLGWAHLGWPLLIALVLAGLAGLAIGARRSTAGARYLAAIAIPTALVMFVVSLYQRAVGTQMLWVESAYNGTGSRYAVVPALLLVSAAVVLIDGAARRNTLSARPTPLSAATVALLSVALVTSFWVGDKATRGTPPWDAALKAAAVTCAREGVPDVGVPTSPPRFGLEVQCDRILDAYPSPRPAGGALLDGGAPR